MTTLLLVFVAIVVILFAFVGWCICAIAGQADDDNEKIMEKINGGADGNERRDRD